MAEVLTIGETMVLFLAEQPGPLSEAVTFRRCIAGAESNVAIGLCRLGHSAAYISRVGDDELGRAILFRLRGEGLDVSRVRVDPEAPTGVFLREQRELGQIQVLYYRRGSAASRLSPADLDEQAIRSARFLHLTGITPALSATCREAVFAAAEIAQAAGVTVLLDPNLRLKLWTADEARLTLRDLASHCDVVLPGLDEAKLLTGEEDSEAAGRALLKLGPELAVLKLGPRGSMAVEAAGGILRAPGMPLVRVIDPIGAGDAFAAGFLAGRLRDFSLEKTLDLANRCGAFAASLPGDAETFPRWHEVAGPISGGDVAR